MSNVIYRSAKEEDVNNILLLAENEAGEELSRGRILDDLGRYPSQVALEGSKLLGFAVSEELSPDLLLVHTLIVRADHRCDEVGRSLLELIESEATTRGYHGIAVSGFVQGALLGCESDSVTFAGYRDVYNTGRSRLLVRSIN